MLAGGVLEEVAAPEWLLRMGVFFPAAGALRSLAADLLSSSPSRFLGAAGCDFPSSESVWRRLRCELPEEDDGLALDGGEDGAEWRFLRTEDRRLPDRGGAHLIQSVWGGAAAARRRSVHVFVLEAESQEGLSVIFLFPGAFCKNPV